jgi:hypothetical protein
MQLDRALKILDGGELRIYETPLGTKLSVKTPTGEDWAMVGEEYEAAREVVDDYEDVAVAVYEADDKVEKSRILADADVGEPWKVVGAVEDISLTGDEARRLAD